MFREQKQKDDYTEYRTSEIKTNTYFWYGDNVLNF